MVRLLDVPQPGTGEAAAAEAIAGIAFAAAAVPVEAWPVWPSTGFLERWRPLFMCRSQYFWSATASLEHRHFLPSVRRHLPGSGSVLPEKPRWNEPHPTATILERSELSLPEKYPWFLHIWRSSVDLVITHTSEEESYMHWIKNHKNFEFLCCIRQVLAHILDWKNSIIL